MTIVSSLSRAGLAALLALIVGVASVSASGGGADVSTSDVTWTILAANCSQMPAGAVLNGKGSLTSITIDKTRNGVRTIQNFSHAFGSATDGLGRTYAWSYTNHYRISNTDADHHTYSGTMLDHFSIAGNGNAGFVNGFTAAYKEVYDGAGNLVSFSFVPGRVQGDPIAFDPFEQHCDPL
jgi:hypothetical protein